MPINNYEDYLSQISLQNAETFQYNQATIPGNAGRLALMSRYFPIVLSTPSSSIALDNTSLYAINNQSNPLGTSNFFLLGGQIQSGGAHTIVVVDLLNVSGGLSGILTTEQTTGLPTAPLTRYISGEGVFAGLILWVTTGGTVTVSINYTNQNGIPEQISPLTSFFGSATGDRQVGRILLMPLASGDTGVQSVKSVTLSSSTAIVGNFGVILFKPLSMIAFNNETVAFDAVSSGGFVGSLSTIFPSACLSGILSPGIATQAVSGSLFLGE